MTYQTRKLLLFIELSLEKAIAQCTIKQVDALRTYIGQNSPFDGIIDSIVDSLANQTLPDDWQRADKINELVEEQKELIADKQRAAKLENLRRRRVKITIKADNYSVYGFLSHKQAATTGEQSHSLMELCRMLIEGQKVASILGHLHEQVNCSSLTSLLDAKSYKWLNFYTFCCALSVTK